MPLCSIEAVGPVRCAADYECRTLQVASPVYALRASEGKLPAGGRKARRASTFSPGNSSGRQAKRQRCTLNLPVDATAAAAHSSGYTAKLRGAATAAAVAASAAELKPEAKHPNAPSAAAPRANQSDTASVPPDQPIQPALQSHPLLAPQTGSGTRARTHSQPATPPQPQIEPQKARQGRSPSAVAAGQVAPHPLSAAEVAASNAAAKVVEARASDAAGTMLAAAHEHFQEHRARQHYEQWHQ